MSQIVTKSAVSVLEEFCQRKLQPPGVYTFTSDDNTSDFVCTVAAFNETKIGKAKSKKKAKHAAAENLINHLRTLESFKFDLVFLKVEPTTVDDTKVTSSTSDAKKRNSPAKSEPEINYVGQLLEYCAKNKLPPASFDLIEHTENAQSHLREYSMKCRVNDIEKEGKGFNKKQAKRTAAMEVLNVLTKGQSEPSDTSEVDELPQKRLKVVETPKKADTSSTSTENATTTLTGENMGKGPTATKGQSEPSDTSEVDELPQKRLKVVETPKEADTSSTSTENNTSTMTGENMGKETEFNKYLFDHWNDSADEEQIDEINSNDVFSAQSERYSDEYDVLW